MNTSKRNKSFHYKNIEHKQQGKYRITRKVHIKGGSKSKKGTKSVSWMRGGKRIFSIRKSLDNDEIHKICNGKFIPGLFSDCKPER